MISTVVEAGGGQPIGYKPAPLFSRDSVAFWQENPSWLEGLLCSIQVVQEAWQGGDGLHHCVRLGG